ncbi:MAG: YqaE/Pmp3 family membrane protein [Plectolyngbya sp. WJT66-NPBG17]|jgi:uncharacterized membrane protein YqaE (UPF0057 family)|nr:YqaE/Pmp3 family membrane protein [Plectolyngbya sp. WJT66-NPBG17]MBW4527454.1 YqaE/Pmp3 family membrane protein [Phormidium tanganyikae FI6-MK23]
MNFLRLVFAVVLPPVAVFMTSGVSSALLVSILLTLVGWVPGIIHAIWYIQKTDQRRGAY